MIRTKGAHRPNPLRSPPTRMSEKSFEGPYLIPSINRARSILALDEARRAVFETRDALKRRRQLRETQK